MSSKVMKAAVYREFARMAPSQQRVVRLLQERFGKTFEDAVEATPPESPVEAERAWYRRYMSASARAVLAWYRQQAAAQQASYYQTQYQQQALAPPVKRGLTFYAPRAAARQQMLGYKFSQQVTWPKSPFLRFTP
jgi:hypothetical protein